MFRPRRCGVSSGLVLLVGMMLSSCLTHEARVTTTPDAPEVEGGTAIGRATYPSPPGPPRETLARGPLPQHLPITAWRRDGEGLISRAEAELLTPLPWWQRFPCDIVSDLMPTPIVVRAECVLVLRPVVGCTRAELDAAAAAAGYAQIVPASSPLDGRKNP